MKDKIKLKEGEVICDKCNGTGGEYQDPNVGPKMSNYFIKCDKCYGSGKLDWIENIVGKKDRYKRIYSADLFEQEYHNFTASNEITKELSKKLADKIDKSILDCLINIRKKTEWGM